jgi:cytochrome c2
MEGRYAARAYTPSLLASLIWNHAPKMWPAMAAAGIPQPRLSEQDASDLFAYFYAARYMDQPGDAGRGLQAFRDLRCAECHSISQPGRDGAPPVVGWTSLADTLALATAMWNHAPRMRESMARRKVPWPVVSSQTLTDLLVYLRNAPGVRVSGHQFSLGPAEMGATLFNTKGCAACHKGLLSLAGTIRGRTPTDFAAAM